MRIAREVEIRLSQAADARDIAKLHADSWRRHYRGAYSDRYLDGDLDADRLAVWTERLNETMITLPRLPQQTVRRRGGTCRRSAPSIGEQSQRERPVRNDGACEASRWRPSRVPLPRAARKWQALATRTR